MLRKRKAIERHFGLVISKKLQPQTGASAR
jgi:hypothetical protein